MITACLVERVYFCSDLYNSMRENKLISRVRTTSFKKIVSYLASNKANLGGDIYVGTEFAIGLGCLPPFSPVHDKTDLVRLDVLRVIIIKSGWCEPVINFKKYRCGPGDILFINWGVAIKEDALGRDITFDGFMMTQEYLKMIFHGRLPKRFLSPNLCFSFHMQDFELDIWSQYIRQLYSLANIQSMANEEAMKALFGSAMAFAMSLYKSRMPQNDDMWSRSKELIEHFLYFVDQYAKTQHELDFYASKLCVSTHYLGMIVKKETGETAKAILDKALLLLIKLELRYSNKPLKVLADEFHFVTLSAFCKFFKRCAGVTASEYRMMPDNQHEESLPLYNLEKAKSKGEGPYL